MAYSPLNTNVFIAALAGALAGIAVAGRQISDTTAADYAPQVNAAGAYAQSFDTAWGVTAPSTLAIQCIQEESEAVWADRFPGSVTPAFYTPICNALIATITQAGTYVTGQGIVIPQANQAIEFTYQQGGVAGNGIYTSFATAYAAAIAKGVRVTLYVDNSLGSPVVTAGAYDFTRITLANFKPQTITILILQDGVTVSNWSRINNLTIESQSLSTITTISTAGFMMYLHDAARFRTSGACAAPIFSVVSAFPVWNLYESSAFLAPTAPSTQAVASFDAGSTGTIFAAVPSTVAAGSLAGAGACQVFGQGANVSVGAQAGLLGAFSVSGIIQRGIATIDGVTGKTVAITANLTAASRIFCNVNSPANDALTAKGYAAQGADRTVAASTIASTFKISALVAAGSGAVNTADTSTVDWTVES